jgi:hypothetical protein
VIEPVVKRFPAIVMPSPLISYGDGSAGWCAQLPRTQEKSMTYIMPVDPPQLQKMGKMHRRRLHDRVHGRVGPRRTRQRRAGANDGGDKPNEGAHVRITVPVSSLPAA